MGEQRILDYERPKAPERQRVGCLPQVLIFAIVLAAVFVWSVLDGGGFDRHVRAQIYINAATTVITASAILFVIWRRSKRR